MDAAILLERAPDPQQPAVLAHAGVIGSAWSRYGVEVLPLIGLDAQATRHLLDRYFPGAQASPELDWVRLDGGTRQDRRADEIDDLVALLKDHACGPEVASAEEIGWLAHTIANASLGDNHLWQDMGLPSRGVLSALMSTYFPDLAARNDRDMKWKKFLYKQLCEREELMICKAPSCSVCVDQPICFGSEDA